MNDLKNGKIWAENVVGLPHMIDRYLRDASPLRKVLMMDDIPSGACAVYDCGDDGEVHYLATKGEYITKTLPHYGYSFHSKRYELTHEVFLPTVEHFEKALIIGDAEHDYPVMLDLCRKFAQFETDILVELLMRTCQVSIGEPGSALVNSAFRDIEQHDLCVNHLIMTPSTAKRLPLCEMGVDDGHLYTADISYVSHPRLDGKVFCLSAPDINGVIAERTSLYVLYGLGREVTVIYDIGVMLKGLSVSCGQFLDCDYCVGGGVAPTDAEIKVL